MPKSAAALSNTLQTRWQRWGVYGSFLLLSVFLLLIEQASAARGIWDIARLSAFPGVSFVAFVQTQKQDVISWTERRQRVLSRIAELESERLQQSVELARLTEFIQSNQLLNENNSFSGSFHPENWQSTTWEGVSGSWQVQAGCRHGVASGDPVVTKEGVYVGTIQDTYSYFSTVQSWDTAGWSLPVRVGTSSAIALVTATHNEPSISHLRWPSEVQPSEVILTAGTERIPRNLLVGSVNTLEDFPAFGEVRGTVFLPRTATSLAEVYVPIGEGETCQQ